MQLKKADQMKILRKLCPKNQLRPYCAKCIQNGGSFTDWAKSAYGWVKDKVETVTNSDVYKAVAPAVEEYVLPILKEQAMKMFKEYTGMGGSYSQGMKHYGANGQLIGYGLNVAGGCSGCSHGGALRAAGNHRGRGIIRGRANVNNALKEIGKGLVGLLI